MRQGTKTLIFILIIILEIIFVYVVLTRAEEYKKEYDPINKTIYIKDATNKSLVYYTLDENTHYCSKYCYFWIGGYAESDVLLYDNITFIDKENKTKELPNIIAAFDDKGKLLDGKVKFKGKFKLFGQGWKSPSDSIDWILSALNISLKEWIWWNSWQDWNDDFEDSSINQTFWQNKTGGCTYSSPLGTSTHYITEAAGQLQQYAYSTVGGGIHYAGWTGIRTRQDFNDDKKYEINFTYWVYAVQSNYAGIFIMNSSDTFDFTYGTNCDTSGALGGMIEQKQAINIHNFSAADNQNFTLTIYPASHEVVLKNSTNIYANVSVASKTGEWYLAFEAYTDLIGGVATTDVKMLNFTVTSSSVSAKSYLISPADGNVSSDYTSQIFKASLNASGTNANLTNATFYLWNSSGSVKNTTLIMYNMAVPSAISSLELFNLNYTTYKWNFKTCASDGADSNCGWATSNWTLTINDTINPSLNITTPIGTVSNKTFNITIDASDYGGLSYCYYNITRALTTEVANTQIVNCANTTATVTGDADYVLHVWVNDTAGNVNSTNQSFTVSGSGTVVVVVGSGSSGGGGGGFIERLVNITSANKGYFCEPAYPKVEKSWSEFKKEKSWKNFIELWEAFWNYGACKQTASFLPI